MNSEVPGSPASPLDRRDLSIVVQGSLSRDTLVPTAVRCRHWRELFPDAEIILSLSGTDAIGGIVVDGVLTKPRVVRSLRADTHLVAALEALTKSCDLIALRTDGLPLPPIKSDAAKPNNINLQIAAAQNGLRNATRTFVLRVRSDLVFLDDGFIDQWQTMAALPRGNRASLSQRVMISWLYTLNPFTVERLPLHLSDWFHFGTLQDVRALWDVPFVSFADAVHFQANPHPQESSLGERMFNIRIAVEQHIIFQAMRKHAPDLKLDVLTDRSSVDLAMDILADDFCLCDLSDAKCIFEKYGAEFFNAEKKVHCLTPEDWRSMVDNRGVNYRTTLAPKIREAQDRRSFEREEGFPRVYPASRLWTKAGRRINGEIVADARSGTLIFGPHVAIPIGRYRAQVEATTLEGPGMLVLKATLDHGHQVLAERRIRIAQDVRPDLSLDFDVTQPNAGDFEIVVDMEGLRNVAIAEIRLLERNETPTLPRFPLHVPSADPARNLAPAATSDERRADGAVWHVVGRALGLRPGRYAAALDIRAAEGVGTIFIRGKGAGGRVFSERSLVFGADDRVDATIEFNVEQPNAEPIDIECRASGLSRLEVNGVAVSQNSPIGHDASFPRFFRAAQLHTQEGVFRDDEIVFSRKSGRISYGPYVSLPPGDYVATFLLSRVSGAGQLSLAVTADVGRLRLAESRLPVSGRSDMRPSIRFQVTSPGASEVEVLGSADGLAEIALAGLLIDKLP